MAIPTKSRSSTPTPRRFGPLPATRYPAVPPSRRPGVPLSSVEAQRSFLRSFLRALDCSGPDKPLSDAAGCRRG